MSQQQKTLGHGQQLCEVPSTFQITNEWFWSGTYFDSGFCITLTLLGRRFQILSYFVWPRITDEGSVPEMRIWSIL